jgi:NDP-hexose 4,6-dehydratase
MKKNILANKRVLVTGADGFMGSHLTEKLIQTGAIVSVYVRGNSRSNTSTPTLKNIYDLRPKLEEIIAGDIGSQDSIELIKNNKSEYIFHLAADAYVPNSFDHPREVTNTNVDGTLNVLHAIMDMNIQQAVFTSSSEIYGTHQRAIHEEDPMYPSSPYAASKASADRFCYAYWSTYNLPISIIRPFNTYGPRHTYDVIPKFIDLALKGEPLTIYGDGSQTRDFTYVDDTVRGFMIMGSNPKAIGQAVNFGSGQDYSISEIALMIKELCNSESKIIHTGKRTSEVGKLLCDFKKANELFSWEPNITILEGLKRNIDYVQKC